MSSSFMRTALWMARSPEDRATTVILRRSGERFHTPSTQWTRSPTCRIGSYG